MNNKTKAGLRHCAVRAMQRYNLKIGPDENKELVDQIKAGKAEFILDECSKRSRFIVTQMGIRLPIIYDRSCEEIIDCLPVDVLKEWDKKNEDNNVREG